jgi:spoIIIJ-associated protein
MKEALQVEATGETVGEAKWNALRELERAQPGLDKSRVAFQVLSEGERGLLGVGYTPARVVASVPEGAVLVADRPPEDESHLATDVRDVLERVLSALGVPCRVAIAEDEETLTASCSGQDVALLIGKHGQTLDAVQYLVNAIVQRSSDESAKRVVVDAAGYRDRRQATLEAVALRAADQIRAGEERVELEPMSAAERKIVHLRLQREPGIATESEGTEPHRCVVVTRDGV